MVWRNDYADFPFQPHVEVEKPRVRVYGWSHHVAAKERSRRVIARVTDPLVYPFGGTGESCQHLVARSRCKVVWRVPGAALVRRYGGRRVHAAQDPR